MPFIFRARFAHGHVSSYVISLVALNSFKIICRIRFTSPTASLNLSSVVIIVKVYDINGSRLDIVSLGPVLNVVRYINGFIAVQSKSLSIFKGPSAVLTSTLTSKTKPGQRGRVTLFDNIHDVAVNSQQVRQPDLLYDVFQYF